MRQPTLSPEIQEILEHYLAGSGISDREQQALSDWIAESPDNKELFTDLNHTEFDLRSTLEEPERNWQAFEKRLKRNRFRKITRYLRYAAVVMVCVAGFGLWNLLREEPKPRLFTCSAGDSPAMIILPDGSSVKLGSNSTLIYNDRFNVDNRNTRLIGEAFFVVDKGHELPFSVTSGSHEITVTGTMFNVSARIDTVFVATLVEGSIIYENALSNTRTKLVAGTTLRYNTITHRINTTKSNLTATDFLENEHLFSAVPLRNILEKMGELYGLKILCNDTEALHKVYRTSFFEGEDANEFLEIVGELCSLDYRYVNDNCVILSSK